MILDLFEKYDLNTIENRFNAFPGVGYCYEKQIVRYIDVFFAIPIYKKGDIDLEEVALKLMVAAACDNVRENFDRFVYDYTINDKRIIELAKLFGGSGSVIHIDKKYAKLIYIESKNHFGMACLNNFGIILN